MPSPTAGFQLSALPEPLTIPTNIGRYDVAQSQLAQANAMKNAQTASLLGPQTRALLAEAQKARLEAQNAAARAQALSSFMAPAAEAEARANIATNQATGATQENIRSAALGAAPFVGPTASSNAIADLIIANLAAKSKFGVPTMPIDVGGTNITGVIGRDRSVTPFGGTSLVNAILTKPAGEISWIPTGSSPRTDASGRIINEYQQVQTNAIGGVTKIGNPVWSYGPPSAQSGAGAAVVSPSTNIGTGTNVPSDSQQAPVDSAQVVSTPWGDFGKDSRDAKAWEDIKKTQKIYENVRIDDSPAERKARADLFEENSNVIALTSQQAVAIGFLQNAFDRMNQQGIKQGTISSLITSKILSPEIVGAISNSLGLSLDGSMDVNQASLAAVEKLGSDIKNLRAYAGIKELLVSAKPQSTDTPEVTASKMARIIDAISMAQNRAEAINTALDVGIPRLKALSIADKNYAVSANLKKTEQSSGGAKEKLAAPDWLKINTGKYSDAVSAWEAYNKE
jgi:hypothetical protein